MVLHEMLTNFSKISIGVKVALIKWWFSVVAERWSNPTSSPVSTRGFESCLPFAVAPSEYYFN